MSVIFYDNKFMKVKRERLESLMPGSVDGKGAFETMVVYNGRLILWNEHWNRLSRALKLFQIKDLSSQKKVEGFIKKILVKNKLLNARVRLMVWKDNSGIHISIVAQKITKLSHEKKSYKLMTSSFIRNKSRYSHIKSIDYSVFHKAHKEALQNSFDEALLLNSQGFSVEAAYANIFIVKGGVLMTPKVSDGCLNGITRSMIMRLARENGIKCVVCQLTQKDIMSADEMFLTNSVKGITPVSSLNASPIRGSKLGAISSQLDDLYHVYLQQLIKE